MRRLGNSGLVPAVGLGVGNSAHVALAWLFAQGDDIIPIPGTKQQKYLEQNVAALDLADAIRI